MHKIIKCHLIKDNEFIFNNQEYLDGFFHTLLSQSALKYDFDYLMIVFENEKSIKIPSKKKLIKDKPKEVSEIDHYNWSNENFKFQK